MLDFHFKEKKLKWVYKTTEDLSISSTIYNIEVGVKLDLKKVDISMI